MLSLHVTRCQPVYGQLISFMQKLQPTFQSCCRSQVYNIWYSLYFATVTKIAVGQTHLLHTAYSGLEQFKTDIKSQHCITLQRHEIAAAALAIDDCISSITEQHLWRVTVSVSKSTDCKQAMLINITKPTTTDQTSLAQTVSCTNCQQMSH